MRRIEISLWCCLVFGLIIGVVAIKKEHESDTQTVSARPIIISSNSVGQLISDDPAVTNIDQLGFGNNRKTHFLYNLKDGSTTTSASVYQEDNKTRHARPGVIWVSFEEDGKHWMVGALKEYATAAEDPAYVQTAFKEEYCVKIENYEDKILFPNCCTTNIIIQSNYSGTMQIGTNFFRYVDLNHEHH